MSEKQMREERIREAAYFLWEEAGHPESRAYEFWLAAEKADGDGTEGETSGEDGATGG